MARVQTDTSINAEALRTVAGPKMQAVQVSADPNSSSGFQLAQALGAAGPVLDKFQEDYQRRKTQQQLLQVDAYKERFKADNKSGAVSEAQIGKLYPEVVPTIRARISEGVGLDYGRTLIQPALEEVLKNDSIRLDSAKRAEFLKGKRDELIGGLIGDDFYKSGVIRAIDSELKTYENTWQQQTATYHNEVQAKDFRTKVSDVFKTYGGPQGVSEALEQLDAQWKTSSSLNNLERNKIVVDEVTNLAFAADRPEMLDLIPDRFLNTESKAELLKMKNAITTKRISDFRNAQYLKGVEREENVRSGKLSMIDSVLANKPVDPGQYRNDPELFAYAMDMRNVDRLPDVQSVATAANLRDAILSDSSVEGVSSEGLIKKILDTDKMNPKEKKALIDEVPKLLEGRLAMDDPMVKNVIELRINPALQALERSTNSVIQRIMTGENLRGQAIKNFEVGVRSAFLAYYEDNKRWPTGKAKLDIVDAQTEKAEKFIADKTKIGGSVDAAPAPSPAPSPAPAPAPAPAKPNERPAPAQSDIDFMKKSEKDYKDGKITKEQLDGYKKRFKDTFGREP